ncbi:MAG: lytic transglycosylase domain-containing protein [Rhodospirillales bacterium]|nr:lytic transglycosylase domain-containing protein [Rhodospirillales bacterium]
MFARPGRFLACVALSAFFLAAAPGRLLADDIAIATAAFRASDRGDWSEARSLAASAEDPLVAKLVLWMDATRPQSDVTFSELSGFVVDSPDWPLQKTLRIRAEQAIDDWTSNDAVLAWFARNEPLTLSGARRYAFALIAANESARAAAVARAAWVNADAQTIDEEDTFFLTFSDILTADDHRRRLDRMIWAGRIAPATRLLPRLDPADRPVAEARLALRQSDDDAPALLAAVADERRGDPGLVFEEVRFERRRDNDAAAAQLLEQYPVDAAQPDAFWRERSLLARRSLSEGDAADAYRLASSHGYAGNSEEYADAEWLSGWIALRFLQQPQAAQKHFLTMFENVTHPVSRARGAYWSARANAALGEVDGAILWHKTAAQHPVAFYGQLSAAEIRPNEPLRLPPAPVADPAEQVRFDSNELVRAIRLLAATGERDADRAFIVRLADLSDSGAWKDMTASLAHDIGRPDLGVVVARQSVRNGDALIRNGYPMLPVATSAASPVEDALVLAIVRQESGFDVQARSPAGALGLMQLMPATARGIASKLGLPYSPSDLTGSAQYNLALGQAYVASLLNRFDGSYILALAGYNAGPGRANQWVAQNGDPRSGTEAAVDWIEMIPFNETRNYVQRCLEGLQVYRARMGSVMLAQSLGGVSP